MLEDTLLQSSTAEQWKRIGIQHHHGINIPLFSLRSISSCGIGEFTDLSAIFDWCEQIGLDVVQVLPLNDTGPDSSPYSAISAFALNPIHLGLESLPRAGHYADLRPIIKQLKALNQTQRIAYDKVRVLKEKFLKLYHALEYPLISATPEYQSFLQKNRWLRGFAIFKTLKRQHNWETWEKWPEDIKNPSPERWRELENQLEPEISYHEFVQYYCSQQLQTAKARATLAGVFFKGDIPILISRESADLWQHRSLFLEAYSAGAPPDMYAPEGQNWGFPLFNWEAMRQDNYLWWKDRLTVASRYYHLYRLDHIVGFFRIWAIPAGASAKEGFFLPKNESTWLDHGREILQMLVESSPLLPIGEDLGAIPNGVRAAMDDLGICGTKVMRWERHWNTDRGYISIKDYAPKSMTTVSTHDSEPLSLWWKQLPEDASAYARNRGWTYNQKISHEQQLAILHDSHHSSSLFHVNLLQEYLALFPGLVWPNLEDERINVPGTWSDNNWSYRFRPTLEQIIGNDALAEAIRQMVS